MSAAVMRASAPRLTSAVGLLAMLEEQEAQIKAHALTKLNAVVPDFWAEIAESLPDIESLYEDETFPQRQLAALVASKVYFYLGELKDALEYALGAGVLFNVEEGSDFVETLLSKGIDEYCSLYVKRSEQALAAERGSSSDATEVAIDPRLVELVERLVASSLQKRAYQAVMGIALESRRLDMVEQVIRMCEAAPGEHEHEGSTGAMLSHAFDLCSTVSSYDFRHKVLAVLVRVYRSLATPDYIGMCRCLAHLGDGAAVSEVLNKLLEGSKETVLVGYQVAFDLVENSTQSFLKAVLGAITITPSLDAPTQPDAVEAAAPEAAPAAEGAAAAVEEISTEEISTDGYKTEARGNMCSILSGDTPIALTLEFLCRSNKTDLQILSSMKKSVEQRNSLYHSAIVLAHSLMSAGTTADSFLRDNLEWLSRATNWGKFTATATLGVIHRGHVKQAMSLMAPYLPQQGMSASPFSEGGALFALGIIHANHSSDIRTYLLDALRNAGTNEVVQHGACLGLGIAAMGTEDDELYEELKAVLFNDSAVAGEAAALAIGLVMLGSASPKAIEEMLGYAHDTQHEKIIRGLALGIAMCMYGREDESDALTTQLIHDKDPILRYAAMYTIAFAYAGSGSNAALRKLLHVAVSDVADDVRRAAVTAIGFVLAATPAQCPKVVKLLAESYNPHVRYGATIAVGISCAATGLKEALELIEPMLSDPIDYVRQGALLAASMVLMQNSEHGDDSKQAEHRKRLAKVVGDKHEEVMAKFGAILATGLLDAGGRNVTISLISKSGQKQMGGIVGMAVFTHFWFWHPLVLFASLAFTPTAAIGVNGSLRMPKWRFKSGAPPSAYAYPPPLDLKKKEHVFQEKAVLSTTTKASKLAADKGKVTPEEAAAAKAAEEKAAAKAEAEAEEAARDAMLAKLAELKKGSAISSPLHAELTGQPEAAPEAEAAPAAPAAAAAAAAKAPAKAAGKAGKAAETAAPMETGEKLPLEKLVGAITAAHARGAMSTELYSALVALKPKASDAKLEPEPDFEILENPARVLPTQERAISLLADARYVPVTPGRVSGIIVLRDQRPDDAEDLLIATASAGPAGANDDEEEPGPPAPFEFVETEE